MKKKPASTSGFFILRVVVAFILCSLGAGLAVFGLAGPALSNGTIAGATRLAQPIKDPVVALWQLIASTSTPGTQKRMFASRAAAGNSQFSGDAASTAAPAPGMLKPVVAISAVNATSPPLRDLPLASTIPQAPRFEREPGPVHPNRPVPPGFIDPVWQSVASALAMPSPLITFEGQTADDSGCNCIPPDTTGAVGPTQYVQMVNSSVVSVYNKTGTRISGPIQFNSVFNALPAGNACRLRNHGDPVVVYDQLANRWLLSQFTVQGGTEGYHECIAISQTGDATGAYYVYDFPLGTTKFQDYPHFGLWPDAYYMATHQFNTAGTAYLGAGVFAFERDKMLAGQPAQKVYFDLAVVNNNFGGHLPANLDGFILPPAGTPNYFVEVDDGTEIGPSDAMRIWKFHVDWTNPGNSTFGVGGQPNAVLPVAEFTRPSCTLDVSGCVPQPLETTQLDPLGDRLMFRLAYRNFGDHEALVLNHTVISNATTGQMGVRWYEVRNPGGSPTIFQQGTFGPIGQADLLYRWMGSIAMDHAGNIAVGYSTSSQAQFPSIAYAGRLVGDPLNQLAQGEAQMFAGGGSEDPTLFVPPAGRWGDYSHLSVDPTDDCTFWYTNEYFPAPDPLTVWHTRIGSFRFPQCVSIATPLSAASRKSHGAAGPFDIPLPLTGDPGIECRSGGPNGDYDIVFTFAAPVTAGTATCDGNIAATNASGNEITVHCTGITNAQTIAITLNGVSVAMAVLLGDTTADAFVNSADISQTKSRSGQAVGASNFRSDVTVDGFLNSADISLVKSRSGTALPTPP